MLTFVMLIGPSGCGKTTYAHKLATEERELGNPTVVLSSDDIREEIYGDANVQTNPGRVFKIMNDRTFENLAVGHNVIYDATNLSRARRVELIHQILGKHPQCYCEAIAFTTTVEECIRRQSLRKRQVPDDVVKRHHRQMEIPLYEEGWDSIQFE